MNFPDRTILPIILTVAMLLPATPLPLSTLEAEAATLAPADKKSSGSSRKSSSKKQPASKKRSTPQKKSAPNKKSTPKKKSAVKKRSTPRRETSHDVKRQAEAAQKEIVRTKEEIRANDMNISRGVSNLRRLEGDIDVSRKEVKNITVRVGNLQTRIASLEAGIAQGDKELATLRADYLKAVKKMRVARKRNSKLAFLFSAKDFSQAIRRMRYLKQFSEWRERQTALISQKVADLKDQRRRLSQSRVELDKALARQMSAQQKLESQHAEQDAIVVELRRNGEALQSHLARKQSEANQLNSRVASLIAQEEAARRAEEQRREEERRKREAEEAARKAAAEEAARRREAEEAERQRQLADASQREETPSPSKKKETPAPKKKEETPAPSKKKETPATKKKETPRKEEPSRKSDRSYADARRRKPRTSPTPTPAPKSKSETPAPATHSGSDFESMRGRLPKPVGGSFKVVSPFGRQSLPDLPDVVYDNPGIDAEVAQGASALAVYPGKVSAVYVVPGFSTVVIVNHGSYYTVYGNIEKAAVKVGDSVKQGQNLGRLSADSDNPGHSTIHFEVWKRREKLNPMSWIR